ncbi:hypothetical protein [Salmonirosea aquatica]|uniref:hypothetical protein n=1 Tax=Salmonirosea aquatica TaxID=2654236 RepID=UPI003570C550
MNDPEKGLARDIKRIRLIPIIPNLLGITCQTTNMGFAPVARIGILPTVPGVPM